MSIRVVFRGPRYFAWAKSNRWEDKHEKELEEKSRKEEADKKVRREAAYAEIQAWKEERDLNMKKKRDTNRLDEASWMICSMQIPEQS